MLGGKRKNKTHLIRLQFARRQKMFVDVGAVAH